MAVQPFEEDNFDFSEVEDELNLPADEWERLMLS